MSACQSTRQSPNYGVRVPAQITSTEQVRTAILDALTTKHWVILAEEPNYFQASKEAGSTKATIYVVYGYEGYDIEYAFGQNMQYNPDQNTISDRYAYWESALAREINRNINRTLRSIET